MQRTGGVNDASFRIVVLEHTSSPKAGKFVEKVGTYNPKTKARLIDGERVKHWISVGAHPSATVHNMLISAGIIQGKKINILPAYKAPEEAAVAEEVKAEEKAVEQEAKAEAKATHDAEVAAEAEAKAEGSTPEPGAAAAEAAAPEAPAEKPAE